MSYTYLLEVEGGSWEECSSETLPSAPLSLTRTAEACFCSDNETAGCQGSQFGTTSLPSTASHGKVCAISYAEASHARTFLAPEKAPALTVPEAGCGQSLQGSFARLSPDKSSWRIPQCFALEGLPESSPTFPTSGTMRNGECWEQPTLAPGISASECGSWPTPNVPNGCRTLHHVDTFNGKTAYHNGKKVQVGLEQAVKWPTPLAGDAKSTCNATANRSNPDSKHHAGTTLTDAIRSWRSPLASDASKAGRGNFTHQVKNSAVVQYPTPTTQDAKNCGAPSQHNRNSKPLNAVMQYPTPTAITDLGGAAMCKWGGSGAREQLRQVVTPAELNGQLNPDWVEWLMGWPIGWTSLEPLAELVWPDWTVDPADSGEVPRVASGIKHRVARLKAIGNGQVPQCAAMAFKLLTP